MISIAICQPHNRLTKIKFLLECRFHINYQSARFKTQPTVVQTVIFYLPPEFFAFFVVFELLLARALVVVVVRQALHRLQALD